MEYSKKTHKRTKDLILILGLKETINHLARATMCVLVSSCVGEEGCSCNENSINV